MRNLLLPRNSAFTRGRNPPSILGNALFGCNPNNGYNLVCQRFPLKMQAVLEPVLQKPILKLSSNTYHPQPRSFQAFYHGPQMNRYSPDHGVEEYLLEGQQAEGITRNWGHDFIEKMVLQLSFFLILNTTPAVH